MRNNFRTLLTTTAVVAALAGGAVLYAHADSPNSRSSGGMMQGGQGGMPNMMGQMSQMMETCNSMMKGMAQDQGSETPKKKILENKD